MIGLGTAISDLIPPVQAWWPQGAVYAADFVNNRYMRDNIHVGVSQALSFTRDSASWGRDRQGDILAFAPGEMRITHAGLMLDGARTRLSRAPLDLAAVPWINEGAPGLTVLPPEGAFSAPCRIVSDGLSYSRRAQGQPLSAGKTVHLKSRYRAGTSGRFGFYMRTATTGDQSIVDGPAGALTVNSSSGGVWSGLVNTDLGGGLYEIDVDFTPSTTQSDWRFACAPRSNIAGQYVDVLGAMVADGGGMTEWIFGDPGSSFTRNAEELVLHLPTGRHKLQIVFEGAEKQTVSDVGGDFLLPVSQTGWRNILYLFAL